MEETDKKRQEGERRGETKRPTEGQRRDQPKPEKGQRDQDRQKRV